MAETIHLPEYLASSTNHLTNVLLTIINAQTLESRAEQIHEALAEAITNYLESINDFAKQRDHKPEIVWGSIVFCIQTLKLLLEARSSSGPHQELKYLEHVGAMAFSFPILDRLKTEIGLTDTLFLRVVSRDTPFERTIDENTESILFDIAEALKLNAYMLKSSHLIELPEFQDTLKNQTELAIWYYAKASSIIGQMTGTGIPLVSPLQKECKVNISICQLLIANNTLEEIYIREELVSQLAETELQIKILSLPKGNAESIRLARLHYTVALISFKISQPEKCKSHIINALGIYALVESDLGNNALEIIRNLSTHIPVPPECLSYVTKDDIRLISRLISMYRALTDGGLPSLELIPI